MVSNNVTCIVRGEAFCEFCCSRWCGDEDMELDMSTVWLRCGEARDKEEEENELLIDSDVDDEQMMS